MSLVYFSPRLRSLHPSVHIGLVALSNALKSHGPSLGLQLPIRAVVAGGAIAVLKFGARISTHDVDFALDANQIELENAIQQLADHVTIQLCAGDQDSTLGKFWFNPAMSYYLNTEPYRGAYKEALQQNEVLFQSDSLVLYIAPWKFQLYRKIARVAKALWNNGERRVNDIEDAVDLIYRFNTQLGRNLTLDEVKRWYSDPAAKMGHKRTREAAGVISERYRAKYGGKFSL